MTPTTKRRGGIGSYWRNIAAPVIAAARERAGADPEALVRELANVYPFRDLPGSAPWKAWQQEVRAQLGISLTPRRRKQRIPHGQRSLLDGWAPDVPEKKAECLAAWPQCFDGGSHPDCCNWPQRCDCLINPTTQRK